MVSREFGVGITFLELLANADVPNKSNRGIRLWVPANFLRLVERAQESELHRIFLLRVMRSFVAPARAGDEASPNRIRQEHVMRLIANVQKLRQSQSLLPIEQTDDEIEARLEEIFPRSQFGIELSPEQNFVARYLGSVIGWSKKTGKAILEGSERAINHIGSAIASLRIPETWRNFHTSKEQLSTELLTDIGISKDLKKFITISIGLASPFLAVAGSPAVAAGVLGFWLAITDP